MSKLPCSMHIPNAGCSVKNAEARRGLSRMQQENAGVLLHAMTYMPANQFGHRSMQKKVPEDPVARFLPHVLHRCISELGNTTLFTLSSTYSSAGLPVLYQGFPYTSFFPIEILSKFCSKKYPLDHQILDSAPNLGPLISRWEINKFENC